MTSKICIYDPRRIYVFTQATLFCRDVHTPPGSSPFLSPSPCSSPSPTEPHPHSLKNPTPRTCLLCCGSSPDRAQPGLSFPPADTCSPFKLSSKPPLAGSLSPPELSMPRQRLQNAWRLYVTKCYHTCFCDHAQGPPLRNRRW